MTRRFENRPNMETHPKAYRQWNDDVEARIKEAREILIIKIEEMEEHLRESMPDDDRDGALLVDAVSLVVEEICENLSQTNWDLPGRLDA